MSSRYLNSTNWKFKLTCVILALMICFGAYQHWFQPIPPPHSSLFTIPGVVQETSQSFTSDEMTFFTIGKGDALKHERRLLEYIRGRVFRPSGTQPVLESRFPFGSDFSQIGQSKAIDNLLNGRRNGFFLECGANDGEYLSNSLFFELWRNWTGLLIEADPNAQKALMKKKRNAFFLPSCISVTSTPSVVAFDVAGVGGGIVSERADMKMLGNTQMVQCYPFNSIMDSLGVSHIDYFSLDVERAELGILKTIDFKRIRIDVISIEYSGSTVELSVKRHAAFVDFFKQTAQRYERQYEIAFYLPKGSTVKTGQDVVFKLRM